MHLHPSHRQPPEHPHLRRLENHLMNTFPSRPRLLLAATASLAALFIAGCASPPALTPAPVTAPPVAVTPPVQPQIEPPKGPVSAAINPRDYRRDAASHLYGQNAHRIFKGKLPPLLYAIGVLQVDVDGQGRVSALRWMRAPSHAPEVVTEIERTVRLAAPYPVPVRMGQVTYTDTWLWHKSGRFQLDTLTEGQF